MILWRPLPLPTLAPGRTGESVLQTLQSLANGARNVRSSGPGYQIALSRYVDWISTAETQLRSIFTGEEAVEALHTRRYWFLVEVGPGAEPWRFLNEEVELQASIIEQYQEQLRHEIEVFQLGENELAVVLDTNFLLHYKPIDHVQWQDHLDASGYRLVIPAAVIKELDDKKYHRDQKLSSTAKKVIRFLYELRDGAHPEEPVPLSGQPSVTVQILLDPAGHRRASAADDEILDRAEHLAGVVGGQLKVATADYGVHLAASVRGLATWRPEDSLRRRKETGAMVGYAIGDLRDEALHGGHRDWVVGSFVEDKFDPRFTEQLEVKYWEFVAGDNTGHEQVKESSTTEWTFLLEGRLRAIIGDDTFELGAGQYVLIHPNTPNNLISEVLEDAKGITVKSPSDPSAKQLIGTSRSDVRQARLGPVDLGRP